MNKSGRKATDNICNIFTLLSVVMLIYTAFIAINEHRLDNLLVVEKMKIISIEEREDNDDYLPKYKIEVQQNINGHDYTTYISRIPTGYTERTMKNDRTSDYKVGDMAEVYIDSSTLTDNDFHIVYNLSLFRSGELGYVSTFPLVLAVVCFILGIARISKMTEFCKKHMVFVILSLIFSIVTCGLYLMWEISLRYSTSMFKGLGEGIILNGLLIVGMIVYIVTAICIVVTDHKKLRVDDRQ